MAAQKMQVFRGSCSTDMSQGCSKSRNKTTFFVVLAHLAPICSFTSPWSCSSDGCPANPGQLPVLWCHLQGCTVAEKLLLPTSNNE